MNLQELREKLDEVDERLVTAFVERMNLAGAVARYKAQAGLPTLDTGREQAVLSRVAGLGGPDFAQDCQTLYETILALSKQYQEKTRAR